MLDKYGYIIRNEIVIKKMNGMPSSIKDRFTPNFEKWWFIVKNDKPIYWVNQNTLQLTTKHPNGIKGIEGIDWCWEICTDCLKKIEEDFTNKKKKSDLFIKYLEPMKENLWFLLDGQQDIGLLFTTMSNLSQERIKSLHFNSVCDKKSCINGKVKSTLWKSYDYYFDQQFEPLIQTYRKMTKNARNKHNDYGNPTYSGFVYNSQDFLHGKNKRAVWELTFSTLKPDISKKDREFILKRLKEEGLL